MRIINKLILSLLVLHITFTLLCSCGLVSPQKYSCDVNEVETINIVMLNEYVKDDYSYKYTVLSQISDCSTFVDQLSKVDHTVNWGDPRQLQVQCVAIRIDYLNGDFDLIQPDAQIFNRSEVNQYGYYFFDDEQFDKLIADYVTE